MEFVWLKKLAESYGFHVDPEVSKISSLNTVKHITKVYSMLTLQKFVQLVNQVLSQELPDAYGRGRIIGDYRRVALYGVEFV